ncbi:hypothetical protein AB0M20_00535 [Actinoplanes sp. NPDC051633]|uniref:hypothetical protein n=1 Tax=Actinoplanes sp. NPDC051633 TaxID=3155670 RepID=UPI003434F270
MSNPRAFVGFDFEHDERWRNLFVGQARTDSPTPFAVDDWSSRVDLPQAVWQEIIRQRISQTNMCIVLSGRHMASAGGVALEIAMARELDVPSFGVYVDGAGVSSPLPFGLPRKRVIAWNWNAIGAAVTQMMGEGKNA